MPMTKTCRKCGKKKPLTEFYKHPRMADGRLNHCKTCKRTYQRKRYCEKSKDAEWVKAERARGREKHRRLNYTEKYKPSPEEKLKRTREYRKRYPEKYAARGYVANNLDVPDGLQAHHWSYLEEYYGDVILLSHKKHMRLHRFLEYDQEAMCYRDRNGALLDTREKHLRVVRSVLDSAPQLQAA